MQAAQISCQFINYKSNTQIGKMLSVYTKVEFILESNRYSPDAWNISALLCHAGIIGTKGCLVTSTERLAHIFAWLRTTQHTHTPKVISEAKSFYLRSTKAVGVRKMLRKNSSFYD